MSASSSALELEVVAAHPAGWDASAVDRFRCGVSAVLERVEQGLGVEHPSVHLLPRCVTADQASALPDGGVSCAVAVIDVTGWDERLALLAGRLQGARVPCIAVCHADHLEAARRSGLSNSDPVTYTSMDDLFLADSVLQQELLRAVSPARIHEELIYSLWFPRETSTVWVVCPQIHDPGEFADRSSPDYTYLDNLGDTDALLEVMVFLSQYYPTATIERFSAGDLPDGHTSGNLVVIGGPGSAGEISNDICGEMMREMSSHVSYSPDCEQMTVARGDGDTVDLRAEHRSDGHGSEHHYPLGLRQDHGYFARFANPLNENATVVLINGLHTRGVLGAARAFSERREALRNFHAVLASGANPTSFECYFDVPVLNGQVRVPRVEPRNTLSLGPEDGLAARTPASSHARVASGDRRGSVRVLFIAGDRGGSQVGQLQIPKEYHAIQSALRACKHRDVIALANPILGATRERLAEAYRERPGVVHFAGHGSDRSLSIIEDQGLNARAIPLDVDEFCKMLQTMEGRVRLCVLNACESQGVAQQIVEAGAADCAVGWQGEVSDSAAIAFSSALYGAVGDGRGLAAAVNVAMVACGPGFVPVLSAAVGTDMDAGVVGEGDGE